MPAARKDLNTGAALSPRPANKCTWKHMMCQLRLHVPSPLASSVLEKKQKKKQRKAGCTVYIHQRPYAMHRTSRSAHTARRAARPRLIRLLRLLRATNMICHEQSCVPHKCSEHGGDRLSLAPPSGLCAHGCVQRPSTLPQRCASERATCQSQQT